MALRDASRLNFEPFRKRVPSHLGHLLAVHPQQVSVSDPQDLIPAAETLILPTQQHTIHNRQPVMLSIYRAFCSASIAYFVQNGSVVTAT